LDNQDLLLETKVLHRYQPSSRCTTLRQNEMLNGS